MNYYLVDKNFRLVTLIETYESFIWTNRYYEAGEFELFVPATPESLKLYTRAAEENYYIVRDDDDPTNCRAMIVNKISLVTNYNDADHISVTGPCLKGLLSQRIVWGEVALAGNIEEELRNLVYDQCIAPSIQARAFPHLILGDISGVTDSVNANIMGGTISDTLKDACQQKKVGWDLRMNLVTKKIIFTIFKGKDRSYEQKEDDISKRNPYIVFSPEFDNLLGTTYDLDANNYKNIALVFGKLTETDERTGKQTKRDFSQIAYPYKKDSRNPSGYGRYEIFVDGSTYTEADDAENNTSIIASTMKTAGQSKLEEYKSTTTMTGDVVPNYTFNINEDYYIGDLVSIKNEFNQEFTARVIEVVECEEIGKKSTTPKFQVENYIGKEQDDLNPVTEDQMRQVSGLSETGNARYRVIGTGEVRIRGYGRKPKDRVCYINGEEINRRTKNDERVLSILNKVYPDEV